MINLRLDSCKVTINLAEEGTEKTEMRLYIGNEYIYLRESVQNSILSILQGRIVVPAGPRLGQAVAISKEGYKKLQEQIPQSVKQQPE